MSVVRRFLVLLIISFGLMVTASAENPENKFEYPEINDRLFNADSSEVYTVADQMPELIGGLPSLYENIKYPKEAVRQGVEGRVFIQFVVDEEGNATEPEILRDIGSGCAEAAVAAIKQVKFSPGIQDGKPVKVKFSLPVTFQIK